MIKDLTDALIQFRVKHPEAKIFGKIGSGLVIDYDNYFHLFQFKRELYHNFKYHFPEVKKDDGKHYGYAQIMSLEILKRAINDWKVDKLIFALPDGKFYTCFAMLFLNFYKKNNTEVPHIPGEIAMPLDFFEALKTKPTQKGQGKIFSKQQAAGAVKGLLGDLFELEETNSKSNEE
jgi:hypothetical protein|tara:strand:- start:1326 stop:1853 length:528 start_codon:yes stop_codon:yes gene_type:complete